MCPECGKPLVSKRGRFGPFVGCSGYPDCKYIKKDPPKGTGVTCPKCKQGELVQKRTRRGKVFYSCNRYPGLRHGRVVDAAARPLPVLRRPASSTPEAERDTVHRVSAQGVGRDGAELPEEEAKAAVPSPTRAGDGGRKPAGERPRPGRRPAREAQRGSA